MQATQIYSHLYYESKLKAIIADRWVTYHEELGADDNGYTESEQKKHQDVRKLARPLLWFSNKVVKELLDGESAEVKAEVEKCRESGTFKLDDEKESDGEIDAVEVTRQVKATKYQRYGLNPEFCSINLIDEWP